MQEIKMKGQPKLPIGNGQKMNVLLQSSCIWAVNGSLNFETRDDINLGEWEEAKDIGNNSDGLHCQGRLAFFCQKAKLTFPKTIMQEKGEIRKCDLAVQLRIPILPRQGHQHNQGRVSPR